MEVTQKPFSLEVMLWTPKKARAPFSAGGNAIGIGSSVRSPPSFFARMASFLHSLLGTSEERRVQVDPNLAQGSVGDVTEATRVLTDVAPSAVKHGGNWFSWMGWLFSLLLLTLWVRAERQRRES
jgi:hypothetical protein